MNWRILLSVVVIAFLCACSNYQNVPPNDIGMKLTPTGYEGKIYTAGQVDLGEEGATGQMNRLVLIQRSGVEIKEPFIGKQSSEDKEDHRCLTGNKEPVTLDVRLLLALPNYETSDGTNDLARIFLLGNPKEVPDTEGRVLRITAESVYAEQAKQAVRGKIRQICAGYKSFDEMFADFMKDGEDGLQKKLERAVGKVLAERKIPLGLVSAYPSNLKPDPSVIDSIAAQQAAQRRVEAIRTITNFLDEDKSGSRRLVYQMQTWQEIVSKGGANGHNTIFFSPGGLSSVMPLMQK